MDIKTAFQTEHHHLRRELYRGEAKVLNDAEVWYGSSLYPLVTVHDRRKFPCQQVSLDGWGDQAPYWDPPKELHAHLCERVSIQAHRLLEAKPGTGRQANPNWNRFPVPYAESMPWLETRAIDDTVRVASMVEGGPLRIQRANYLDQLATNIQPDVVPAGWQRTLRAAATTKDGRLAPLDDANPLANTLGSCAVLIGSDGVPLLRYRGNMAVMQKAWHCAASGVTRWQDLYWEQRPVPADEPLGVEWLWRGLARGMWRELQEETGLTPQNADLVMTLLAFGRELPRAGKPNVFFAICARKLTCQQLADRIVAANATDGDEYIDDADKGPFGRLLHRIQHDGKTLQFKVDQRMCLDRLFKPGQPVVTLHQTYENHAALRLAAQWWQKGNRGTLMS